MKKLHFGLVLGLFLMVSCTKSDYFLINSDIVARYNRTQGEWQVIWKSSLKHIRVMPDSIPSKFVMETDSAGSVPSSVIE